MPDLPSLYAIESSNLPAPHKSKLRRWYDEMNGRGYISRAKHHATQTAEAIRGGSEGLVIGGVLGMLDAELKNGLDVAIPGTNAQAPIDGTIAALSLAGSAFMGPSEFVSTDMRNTGITCAGIFGYRKMKEFAAMKKSQGGGVAATVSKVAGEMGIGKKPARMHGERAQFGRAALDEDPIVAAAKAL